MAKEPSTAKKPAIDTPTRVDEPAVAQKKKPPKNKPANSADTSVGRTAAEPVEIDGKIVRTDSPALDGATQAFTQDTIASESPEKPAMAASPSKSADEPSPAPAASEKGPTILGNYKLLKSIGKGGMGEVFKAQKIGDNRIVAIKVLAKELSSKESYVLRFEREARVMEKLDHPNILGCLDHGKTTKGRHYIVMEFVEGGSVEGYLKKLGRFSVGDALHIILKTAYALKHAHDGSMIHRDIKPDNILLTKDGIVKVADLGLAKDTEEDVSLTKTGAGAGTPIYMAPEQARDVKHVNGQVDIYALGIMLYVFLTSKPPFEGTTLVELITAKDKGKFDPIRKHNDEVPERLDLIVDKMIAKDLKQRYASCDDVIKALEPLGLANDELTFMAQEEQATVPNTKGPGKGAATDTPSPAAKASPKTSVGNAGKVSPKTSVGAAGKLSPKTSAGKGSAANTNIADDEPEEEAEHDVWYWKMVTKEGKQVTKKMSTEQLRTLIKSGHLEKTADLSKTEKTGFRAAGTFAEFQSFFKARETLSKANVKGKTYRDQYKEIEEQDARRRRWAWLTKRFKGVGGMLFGLLWIVLVLAVVAIAGYLGWSYLR